ncbi:DNA-packaging protein [Bradyrhizobium sp.]|uniref:DNA-packaging protein n=1 Tax=Bradyrhizobium sp. TaxID=376 RepID=UPI003BB10C13
MSLRNSPAGLLANSLADGGWRAKARPSQLAPSGDWNGWLVMAGRGFGKTRTGAEWVREEVEAGRGRRVAMVAPTAADARDTMVEGESGILAISSDWCRPVYEPSKRKITWPNGAIAHTFSSEEADRLRGPQFDLAWADELAAWNDPIAAWSMLQFGLRLGKHPRWIATTTPRPLKLIRELLDREGIDVVVSGGLTFDNADNLAPPFLEAIKKRYEGTRLGRQELNAELLEDTPGALWKREWLDAGRTGNVPHLRRIVVAIDPAVSSHAGSDETGIIVAGIAADGQGYVLEDCSGRFGPDEWARKAVAAYHRWKADRIIAEKNNGGEMIASTIRSIEKNIPFRTVHASRSKVIRAEPISALYEQGKVHHVGTFLELEDQLCAFTSDFDRSRSGSSPDRLDALVWAFSELMLTVETPVAIFGTWGVNVEPWHGVTQGSASKFDGEILAGPLRGGHATSR